MQRKLNREVIRPPEQKPHSDQKVENILVAPPYCQTPCCQQCFFILIFVAFWVFLLKHLRNHLSYRLPKESIPQFPAYFM